MALFWILTFMLTTTLADRTNPDRCTMKIFNDTIFDGHPIPKYVAKDSIITLRCKKMYFDGQIPVRCKGNDQWERMGPKCKLVQCPEPEVHHTASVTVKGKGLDDKAIYSCKEGYMYTGTRERECQRNGMWSGWMGYCRVIQCPRLPILENGWYLPAQYSRNYGNQVVSLCKDGYTYNGTNTRICQHDTTWSGFQGTCVETRFINCPNLAGGSESRVKVTPQRIVYQYKDEIQIHCEEGYTYNGTKTRKCGANSAWSGRGGSCQRTYCLAPPVLQEFLKNATKFEAREYGATFFPECIDGYQFEGTSFTCGETGTWVGSSGECQIVTCQNSDIKNGHLTVSESRYKGAAKLECEDGYKVDGRDTVFCQANGSWTTPGVCMQYGQLSTALSISLPIGLISVIVIAITIGYTWYRIRLNLKSNLPSGEGGEAEDKEFEMVPLLPIKLDKTIDLMTDFIIPRIVVFSFENYAQSFLTKTEGLKTDLQEALTLEKLYDAFNPGCTIVIHGMAGVGTTTLVQKIFHDGQNAPLSMKYHTIILLDLIWLSVMEKVHVPLEKFLKEHQYHHTRGVTLDNDLRDGREVLVIIDTQDEEHTIPTQISDQQERHGSNDADPLSWVVRILKRKVLKKSTLILTSRNIDVSKTYQATIRVEVVGLTDENIKEYVANQVPEKHQLFVLDVLSKNPFLRSASTIAIYCKMLCCVLGNEPLSTINFSQLQTRTGIWAFIVESLITRCYGDIMSGTLRDLMSSNLRRLSNLAYEALIKDDGEIVKYKFCKENEHKEEVTFALNVGLMVKTTPYGKKDEEGPEYFEFIHSSIQAMLAMSYLLTCNKATVCSVFSDMWKSRNLTQALPYLFGLRYGTSSSISKLMNFLKAKSTSMDDHPDLNQLIGPFIEKKKPVTEHQSLWLEQMIYERQSQN